MMNNFMFTEHFAYTFREILARYEFEISKSSENLYNLLVSLNLINEDGQNVSNDYNLSYFEEVSQKSTSGHAHILFNKLSLRYGKHFLTITDRKVGETEKEPFAESLKKIMLVLDFTYPKYKVLLDLYKNQETHLMDKLSRSGTTSKTITGSGSTTERGTDNDTTNTQESVIEDNTLIVKASVNESNNESHSNTKKSETDADNYDEHKIIKNDTPQTSDVVATLEQNQYVSELEKGKVDHHIDSETNDTDNGQSIFQKAGSSQSQTDDDKSKTTNRTDIRTGSTSRTGSTTSNGSESGSSSESYDPTTIMDRISEIQNKYSQVIKKWMNEFDSLFIEEGNI